MWYSLDGRRDSNSRNAAVMYSSQRAYAPCLAVSQGYDDNLYESLAYPKVIASYPKTPYFPTLGNETHRDSTESVLSWPVRSANV